MLAPDYTKAVLAHYRQKSVDKGLPLGMQQLTRRGLRAACHEVCRDKYKGTDEPILKAFFGAGYDQASCLQTIPRYDVDKFRPVVNFLKEETTNPDDKVVELVAWLVDFQPRPYDRRINYAKRLNESADSPWGSLDRDIEDPPAEAGGISAVPPSTQLEGEEKRKKKKRIIWTITITVAVGMTIYGLRSYKMPAPIYIGHQACMYWNEDHYEPISCQEHGDTLVVALDSNKLVHFRKITRPDTITANSIGTIWYARYRKDYEFYTANGFHPIDPNLRLRPITEYIIIHHIRATP